MADLQVDAGSSSQASLWSIAGAWPHDNTAGRRRRQAADGRRSHHWNPRRVIVHVMLPPRQPVLPQVPAVIARDEKVRAVLQPQLTHSRGNPRNAVVNGHKRPPAVAEDGVCLIGLGVGDRQLVSDQPVEVGAGCIVVRRAGGDELVDPSRCRPAPFGVPGRRREGRWQQSNSSPGIS